jgi:hypothetical protein
VKRVNWFVLFFVCWCFIGIGAANASYIDQSYTSCWDPPNTLVYEGQPYYFPLSLPDWDFEKGDYSKATFKLTYLDQVGLDIFIFAADPATETSNASNYSIELCHVPYTTDYASGTVEVDLLSLLDASTFNALFQGQSTLFLVADCHYYFDKASLDMNVGTVPIPPSILMLGSALIGLLGLKRGSGRV